jgi:hypothetical protein
VKGICKNSPTPSKEQPEKLYSAKLSFKIHGAIKVFHDKQKPKKYMITKPPLQKILQGILHIENESKQNREIKELR